MDYEKLYKKALERASKLRFQNPFDTVGQMMEHVFPELKESEDERIRKWIIDDIIYNMDNEPLNNSEYKKEAEKAIAWLEKLGYKPQGKTALEAIIEEKSPAESLGISQEKYNDIVNECIYGEDADKVEPKFKAGDWITDSIDTTQIDSVNDRFYWHDNNLIGGRIDAMDKAYHLWTIDDAKDGDVLVNGSNIFIFSHLLDIARVMGHCHINLDDGRFYDDKDKTECFGLIDAVFSPATEEQRNLLFAKMKEAGYEWDAEKKELKMLEKQGKPMWTDEDEELLQHCCGAVTAADYYTMEDKEEMTNWLVSLKQRIGG